MGGGVTNVVRRRRYVTPSGEGRKVAGERRRKGGEGCEVSFRPRQQSALSASAASPDRTAGLPHGERHRLRTTVKWALSKKIKEFKKKRQKNKTQRSHFTANDFLSSRVGYEENNK